jgi:hypothetical protein
MSSEPRRVKVALCQRERFLDAPAGALELAHDDDRAQPPAVAVLAGIAHHGHGLLNRRRVGRILKPFVARRPSRVVAPAASRTSVVGRPNRALTAWSWLLLRCDSE